MSGYDRSGRGGSGSHDHGGSGSCGGRYSNNHGGAHSAFDDRRDSRRDDRQGYASQSSDRYRRDDRRDGRRDDRRDDRRDEERGQPPQGPPHNQATHGSSAEEEPHNQVFARFCDAKDTCVCIFSAIGLAWLKEKPSAARIIEEAIGGTLPGKTPDGCKGSLRGGQVGLLEHAAAKKRRAHARGDSSDSEDEDVALIQKGHELFHAYLDRRISVAAQLREAKRKMQGQHREQNKKLQKVHETNHQREEAGAQERRQLVQRNQELERKEQQERKEHQEALEAAHRTLENSMQLLGKEFDQGAFDMLKQARKLERVEAEKRLIQMELIITRRGLVEVEKRRKEELAANLLEIQETNREVEQEREAQIKGRVDELKTKLERKQQECAELTDEKETLEDLSGPLLRQNDILQSKLDAFFLVGACVAECASDDAKLRGVGRDTLWKLRHEARGETEAARKVMRETVRAFLEDPAVKLAHLKHITASLTLDGRDSSLQSAENKLPYIELIMREKFDQR